MTRTGVELLDRDLRRTDGWLIDVGLRLGPTDDREQACRGLRSVLHAIRDRMIAPDAAAFAADLPVPVRGMFYEGWRPVGAACGSGVDDLLDDVRRRFGRESERIAPDVLCRAVFETIDENLPPTVAERMRLALPSRLRPLWPPPHEGDAAAPEPLPRGRPK